MWDRDNWLIVFLRFNFMNSRRCETGTRVRPPRGGLDLDERVNKFAQRKSIELMQMRDHVVGG
jgi:hypothetical protein